MTNENMRYGIYPTLTHATLTPENADSWRLRSCLEFEKQIQNDIEKYFNNLSTKKKKLSNLRIASGILTGSATALSISGTAISATGVGVIVGAPIVGIGVLIGAFSLITLKMEKNIIKEIVKNEKLLTLVNSRLSIMRQNINKYLKDNAISEQEYKYIEYEYNDYRQMVVDLSSSSKKVEKIQNVSTKEKEKLSGSLN